MWGWTSNWVVLSWTSKWFNTRRVRGEGLGVGRHAKEQSGYQDMQCSTSGRVSIKTLCFAHLTMYGGYANHVGQFWVLGKFLVWFQGTRWDAAWSAVLLEPEPVRETMGPVGPNWFGSVVLLESENLWMGQKTMGPTCPKKTQNPFCCTHSLHNKGLKAFIVRRRRRRRRQQLVYFLQKTNKQTNKQASKQVGCTFCKSVQSLSESTFILLFKYNRVICKVFLSSPCLSVFGASF